MAIPNNLTPREQLEQRYRSARADLGIMLALTVVNIVLALTGSDSMMLFSATVPYFTSILAVAVSAEGAPMAVTMIFVVATALIVLLYTLCWVLSKKRVGWMTTALVFFSIDTAFMAYLYLSEQDMSGIIDVVIHAMVIYYLVMGVISGNKLKKLPAEPETVYENNTDTPETEESSSVGLYPADESVKSRVLAEAETAGYHIVYRRVKHVNELVINGYVYDTYEALAEMPHTLRATLNSTVIEAGTDASSHIFIRVNDEDIVKKLRLI